MPLRVAIILVEFIWTIECYGITGMSNDWFKSYLDNRKQFVSLGIVKSDMLSISCGVPQGSGLGPIFFFSYCI